MPQHGRVTRGDANFKQKCTLEILDYVKLRVECRAAVPIYAKARDEAKWLILLCELLFHWKRARTYVYIR
jgi:hypothetical protein